MSIKDRSYSIPRITLEYVSLSLVESANKPFVISGRDVTTAEANEYVVKLNSSERMSPNAALRELLGSFIAIELGIPTPHPAIIEISPEFVESRKGLEDYLRFKNSIGINYGNKYLGNNVIQFIPRTKDSFKGFIRELQEILVFDVFIENSDRTYNKPNILIKEKTAYIIDHEIAFGFIMSVLPNMSPWLIDPAINYLLENHCLYANLKGKKFLANQIFENLLQLNDTFWARAYELLPDEWELDDFFKIRDYLCLKIAHVNEFKDEIMRILK